MKSVSGLISMFVGLWFWVAVVLFVFSGRNFVQSMAWPSEVYAQMQRNVK